VWSISPEIGSIFRELIDAKMIGVSCVGIPTLGWVVVVVFRESTCMWKLGQWTQISRRMRYAKREQIFMTGESEE